MSRGIVSADEIRRRIAAAGGDVTDTDLKRVKSKAPIDFIPSRRMGKDITRGEVVGEYVRYLTAIHEIRHDLDHIPAEQRQVKILAEAEHAASKHFEGAR